MAWNNQYQQNTYGTNNHPIVQKPTNKKLLVLLSIIAVLFVGFALFFIINSGPKSDEEKAAAAAREEIPNAEAKQVVIADGFAMAVVYVPKNEGQLGSGNTTIFRVNEDESMTYISSASYFSPIDLLGFGIPLETQAKLREANLTSIKEELASSCEYGFYGPESPGFSGFDSSFNPDGWQIDSATLDGIIQTLETYSTGENTGNSYDDSIVCINAVIDDSGIDINQTTFASTFKMKLQFISGNGVVTNRNFTFTDGPVFSREYTLDGQNISSD